MTIIEKLEHYLADADLVFALFTPDDFVSHPVTAKHARQNVVLEFGMVLGMFGRKSGRVFYLYKQGVEIPSDLGGVIYIDVSNGVAAAGEQIRTELEDFLRD
jgi:predicted nucleotide-binding protein